MAQEMGLPFVYVRSAGKGHGLGKRIEGELSSGQSVVVIEDLISTGMSSLSAVEALRDAGADVKGLAAIFTYGFDRATESFDNANCRWFALSDYAHLLDKALQSGYIDEVVMESLELWRTAPDNWKKAAHEH